MATKVLNIITRGRQYVNKYDKKEGSYQIKDVKGW